MTATDNLFSATKEKNLMFFPVHGFYPSWVCVTVIVILNAHLDIISNVIVTPVMHQSQF